MNSFFSEALLSCAVFGAAVGLITFAISAAFRWLGGSKMTWVFCLMRFSKGFFIVVFFYVYWLMSLLTGFYPTGTISSILSLAIIVAIIVGVHKATKRIEEKYEGKKDNS